MSYLTFVFFVIQHKNSFDLRFTFAEMSEDIKINTTQRNLDYLLLEMPSYIRRLECLKSNFDATVGWKEFKFCFKLATGQIVSIWLISECPISGERDII